MTKREEFLPAEHPLLCRYNELLEAAELVVQHRCSNCNQPTKYHCTPCVYGPLKQAVTRHKDDKNRQGNGMG